MKAKEVKMIKFICKVINRNAVKGSKIAATMREDESEIFTQGKYIDTIKQNNQRKSK